MRSGVEIDDLRRPYYDATGYKAVRQFREAGYTPGSGTADRHLRTDRATLINIQRSLFRDNWLVDGTLNRAADYILGPTGFTYQADTGLDGVDRKIEQEILPPRLEAPEVRGLHTMEELQRLVLTEMWNGGDQLGLKRKDGTLQHIEAERIRKGYGRSVREDDGTRWEQGVQLDQLGRIVAFHVADVSDYGYVKSDGKTIAARHAFYMPTALRRVSQTRGLPLNVSGMPIAHRLEDILTSEAISWQVMSRLILSITRKDGRNRPAIRDSRSNVTDKGDVDEGEIARRLTEVGYAILYQGVQGDEIKGVTQNRPSLNFTESVRLFVRLYGVPVGIPMEVILLDWGKSNYSVSRTILLQAFLMFRKWQQQLVRRLGSPWYIWQIGRAIAEGRLVWRPRIFKHTIDLPGWPWIDEDKEVKAWAQKIDRAIATQTEALASLGKDARETRQQRKAELIAAWEDAQEIEEATGGGIRAAEIWRHIAGMEQGKTEAAVRAKDSTEGTQNNEDEE
ncbi:MAG: phage portal protein [Armatimonadota bacterium]|jgi:capsid protein